MTGYIFTLAGGAISWAARRQTIVAISTAEAEYVVGAEKAMGAMGLHNILVEALLNVKFQVNITIDNQAAIILSTDPTYSRRTRHIELKWHYIRELITKGKLTMRKVASEENCKGVTHRRYSIPCVLDAQDGIPLKEI